MLTRQDIRHTLENWKQDLERQYNNYQHKRCNKIDDEDKCIKNGCEWTFLHSAPKGLEAGEAWYVCLYNSK